MLADFLGRGGEISSMCSAERAFEFICFVRLKRGEDVHSAWVSSLIFVLYACFVADLL